MTILWIIVAIAAALIIYLSTLPGEYEIKVSKSINADRQDLFDKVNDFHSWPNWSPWLMHEPDCSLEYSENPNEVGGSSHWDGKFIGAGSLTHKVIEDGKHIEHQLQILKPFKSQSKTTFDFEATEKGTQVTWSLEGKMPFLFRPMVRRIKEMISQDYEIGLAQLSGLLCPEDEHPEFSFLGAQDREATSYIAIPWQGSIEEMPEAMQKGFAELFEYIESSEAVAIGQPFTLYHRVKKRGTYFVIEMAVPVEAGTESDKFQVKNIKSGKFHQTQLKGSYNFLKLAWYSAISHLKMTKVKMDWSRPCVELYENDPNKIENSNELVTSIYIPTK